MKKLGLFLIFIVSLIICSSVYASIFWDVVPPPSGLGARAEGMGRAFVAVADDASAISWNPAGLAQLPAVEVGIVWKYVSKTLTEDEVNYEQAHTQMNFLSLMLPFEAMENKLCFGFAFREVYDNDFEASDFKDSSNLNALSFAGALKLGDVFSFGCNLDFHLKGKWTYEHISGYQEEREVKEAVQAGFGALFDFTSKGSKLKFGLVYKTSYTRDFEFTVSESPFTYNGTQKFPGSFAAGLAVVSNRSTFSIDINYYLYSQTKTESDEIYLKPSNWDYSDAVGVNLGFEYLILLEKIIIPFRIGLYYQPLPKIEENVQPVDFFGLNKPDGGGAFTFGTGLAFVNFPLRLDWGFSYHEVGYLETAMGDLTFSEVRSLFSLKFAF